LLALVLGLLVYTAFTVYSTQQSEAQGLGPVVIEPNRAKRPVHQADFGAASGHPLFTG
jgi:hypothetical protein